MRRIDADNADRFKAVVDRRGWPLFSEVGEEAGRAAWLFAQHCGDLEFMERCAELLRDTVAHGEARAVDLAYLEDRINLRHERPQRYGTQWHRHGDGPLELWPLEDPERVNEWRADLGIGPIEDYRPSLCQEPSHA